MNSLTLLIIVVLLISSLHFVVHADSPMQAQQFFEALKNFKPADLIDGYTENPQAAAIELGEGRDPLKALGNAEIAANKTANEIFKEAQKSKGIKNNSSSFEMRYAEKLIENADAVLEEGCYKQPAACKTEWVKKTCAAYANYEHFYCGETLTVEVHTITDILSRPAPAPAMTHLINLVDGSIHTNIKPNCQLLLASAYALGSAEAHLTPLTILKPPTCADPAMLVQGLPTQSSLLVINVKQFFSEDLWSSNDCHLFADKIKDEKCTLAEPNLCIDANQTKTIAGLPFTRPCWEHKARYSCLGGYENNCGPLLDEGCSQIASLCTNLRASNCENFLQTFSCPSQICLPEQTICPGKIACADGSCDQSETLESKDFSQSISQLGVLTGLAEEIRDKQISSAESPNIFVGKKMQCENHILGFRDCCKDSGWGAWVKSCPPDLQELQRAKHEKRTFYLGSYKDHLLGTRKYSYCVFPTKLAGIIQIQGRFGQLGINFGSAKNPDCGGIKSADLQRLDFDRLDLSTLTDELASRKKFPSDKVLQNANEAHIKSLEQRGKPHE